jgi:hypothetical protein
MDADGAGSDTLVGEEIRAVPTLIRARHHLKQSPVPGVLFRLPGEVPVPDMRCSARYFLVGRVDDHKLLPRGEPVGHLGVEDGVLDQVIMT